MASLLIFPPAGLPEKYACQVLTFLRVQWPEGFRGENRLRDWITRPEFHPLSILLVEEDLVISHAQVVWKFLEHAGQRYKTYGITGVFTFPSFRGQGYGAQTIRAATDVILQSDADIGMFHCDPGLASFYARCGWQPMENTITWIGSRDAPVKAGELMMMQFISEKGIRGRETFQNEAVFFDEDSTW
jgi:GNAT superfamily N-acetyltransferase